MVKGNVRLQSMEGQQVRCPTPGHQDTTTHTPSPRTSSPFQNDIFNTSAASVGLAQNQGTLESSSEYLMSNNELQSPNLNQHAFLQAQNVSPNLAPQRDIFSSEMLDANGPIGSGGSFEAQFFPSTSETQNLPLNSTFSLDPQLLEQQSIAGQSINPTTLMNQLSDAQSHSPSSPSMLQSDIFNSSSFTNASPSIDPSFNQDNFASPNRSRHASLDPSAAAFPSGPNADWARGAAFQHRRTPSDTYSDVSSSAVPSPFLGNMDSFDPAEHTSPLLQAQQDQPVLQDMIPFNQFSLAETSPRRVNTAHSPHESPQPDAMQQPLPLFTASNYFGLGPTFGETMTGSPNENPLVTNAQGVSTDYIGQADQTVAPKINIQFAPPSRQPSFEPERVGTALSPPPSSGRVPSRNRARSDPFVSGRIPGSSRSSSTHPTPSTRPSLISQISDPTSLSPHDIVSRPSSRSSSTRGRQSRSSSTSSIPRDYFISLADPNHQPSTSGSPGEESSGTKRIQKHPANFACHLCTKRFTRAYNLRSHLRTHTDERPFVCNVCGKAFARQHDRKRHEGLHSGEKKFVCRGTLRDGNVWGCNRRFARADALGRHFRSEAGRVCIRPLLEEESAERASRERDSANSNPEQIGNSSLAGSMSMSNQNNVYFVGNAAMSASTPPVNSQATGLSMFPSIATPTGGTVAGVGGTGLDEMSPSASSIYAPHAASASSSGYMFPAALLAQFPALAAIQWDAPPPGPPEEVEGDLSGRSSFDASSGGEWVGDEDDSFPGGNGLQQQGQNGAQAQQQQAQAQAQLQQQQQDEAIAQELLYGP